MKTSLRNKKSRLIYQKPHKGVKLPNSRSRTKKRMELKKYHSILNKIELKEIYLESCSAEINRENIEQQRNLEVIIKDKASYEQLKNRLKISHKYFLTAKLPETGKDFAIKTTAKFCLMFATQTTIEKDFFDTFQEINLPLNSWPYFREFVQNITQRMNIPPLTLPFVRRA